MCIYTYFLPYIYGKEAYGNMVNIKNVTESQIKTVRYVPLHIH